VTTLLITLAVLVQQDPAKVEADSKLNNLRITLDFKDSPLEQVVDYLREVSGLNVFVDAKVAEKQIRVSLKVAEISLRSIFALMLKPHGCEIMFREGVVMLMTKEDVADRTVKMELYDCRDILHPIVDFPGVDIVLAVDQAGVIGNIEAGPEYAEIPIAELVRAHTGGKTWDENPKASVNLQNGLLVVRQTPEVHRQIVRLLNLLRANK
jgi:type II secretory pathway component GspD/PulD (secretin)